MENVWYKLFGFNIAEHAFCAHGSRWVKCCTRTTVQAWYYEGATISRLHKNIGLFCKRAL